MESPVSLERFETQHIDLLIDWLSRPHVARWFGDANDHVDWARSPPEAASHAIIAVDGSAAGYLRWQRVSRETLDSVDLVEIPAGSVDADLFIGDTAYVGKGIGPKTLVLLRALLRTDPTIPLLGLSTSVENDVARRAFEKSGFRIARQYSPPLYGPCWLFVTNLAE